MIVITDMWTGANAIAAVTGTGQDIAVMAGSVLKMKDVTGNDDDDCEASAHDADVRDTPAASGARWTA